MPFCGATLASGKKCKREVERRGERCWQHGGYAGATVAGRTTTVVRRPSYRASTYKPKPWSGYRHSAVPAATPAAEMQYFGFMPPPQISQQQQQQQPCAAQPCTAVPCAAQPCTAVPCTPQEKKKLKEAFKLTPIVPSAASEVPPGARKKLPENIAQIRAPGSCGAFPLCTWPKNLHGRGGRNTWTVDPARLYAELFNHASVHSGAEAARLAGDEKPKTWCEILKNTVWPTDDWIEAQYKYIDQNKDYVVGSIWDWQTKRYVPTGFEAYIESYIENAYIIRDSRDAPNPDPPISRVNALMRASAPVNRAFYVFRGVAVDISDEYTKEAASWFDSLQTGDYVQFNPVQPASFSIDSQISLGFATGGMMEFRQQSAVNIRGMLLRILVPEGSRGALPIGRFVSHDSVIKGDQMAENTEQEIWLPSDAKVRLIPSSVRRTNVIFNFGNIGDNPGRCDTYEILTAEGFYEG